jgi:Uma2 family endonuclease
MDLLNVLLGLWQLLRPRLPQRKTGQEASLNITSTVCRRTGAALQTCLGLFQQPVTLGCAKGEWGTAVAAYAAELCYNPSRYDCSMGVKTGVPVEEYLHMTFPDLDREYRDGELVERSTPDYLHGKTQLLLGAFFLALKLPTRVFPCAETRMRLREGLYLIPDIAVFWPDEPPPIPDRPPLIVIEILSSDDRLSAVRVKLEEYRAWGVPNVWLVDPHLRRMYTCEARLMEVEKLVAKEIGVEVEATTIFG